MINLLSIVSLFSTSPPLYSSSPHLAPSAPGIRTFPLNDVIDARPAIMARLITCGAREARREGPRGVTGSGSNERATSGNQLGNVILPSSRQSWDCKAFLPRTTTLGLFLAITV